MQEIKMYNKDIAVLMKEESIGGFGRLEIAPDENIKVDSWIEFLFSFSPEQDIAPMGLLRITVPHFFTTPQIDDPEIVGYTRSAEENEVDAEITLNNTYSCFFTDDGHSGRFGKSIFIKFPQGLEKGNKFSLRYGVKSEKNRGARAPFFSCNAYFVTAIDPYGDRRAPISGYYLLEEQSGFSITGKPAKKANIFLPSISKDGKGKGIIQLSDLDDNIDRDFQGELELFASDPSVEIPEEITILPEDEGVKTFDFKNPSGKDFRIEAASESISGISNFCAGKTEDDYSLYWGEYHVHTYASDGLGTIKEALDYGKNEAALDFAAINDHLSFDEESWDIIKNDANAANEPGRYVTFLGLEITASPNACDYCMISPDMDMDISELCSCEKDPQYHSPSVTTEKYYEFMSKQNAIVIPHFHLGNGQIWNYKAPAQMRLAEIYSCWGAHEYEDCALPSYGLTSVKEGEKDRNTIQELFEHGYRCGFVAGSDSHSGQTGKTKWLRSKQRYKGGLTAVLAKELTRESLWEALLNRRVYATTGARIYLDFRINGNVMGSEFEIEKGSNLNISFKVNGTETTFLTQLIKNSRTWKSFDVATYPDPPAPGRDGILEREIFEEKIQESAYYYLRVTQVDGEMAWSSPIWVDVK
jgi:hypothetical protein